MAVRQVLFISALNSFLRTSSTTGRKGGRQSEGRGPAEKGSHPNTEKEKQVRLDAGTGRGTNDEGKQCLTGKFGGWEEKEKAFEG